MDRNVWARMKGEGGKAGETRSNAATGTSQCIVLSRHGPTIETSQVDPKQTLAFAHVRESGVLIGDSMRVKTSSMVSTALMALAVVLFATGNGVAQETLHSFGEGDDGQTLYSGLVIDAAHNLYGTTVDGGSHGDGTVFRLSPDGHGHWTETVLWNFNGNDGDLPFGGLIFDAAGNLYGTTQYGGAHGENGDGTVFELSPNGGGGWTETVLYSLDAASGDGYSPQAALAMDAAGNLYGTTVWGGTYTDDCPHGCGTVFKLSRKGSEWAETVLYRFDNRDDGPAEPSRGALVLDNAGNVYGTTNLLGANGLGAVFELSPNDQGGWTETTLHAFDRNDPAGVFPYGGVIFDGMGNLYGTTNNGGAYVSGAAYELSPNGRGGWTEKVLHTFGHFDVDGRYPIGGLVFDSRGNLYGTTSEGGIHGEGAVFELSPGLGGFWNEIVFGRFEHPRGTIPEAPVILDAAGNIYSTTALGGAHNLGVVFEIRR